jgi:hypothetical protein
VWIEPVPGRAAVRRVVTDLVKWLIWVPAVVLGLLWWMRRSRNTQGRENR